jgi:hypothetical protein
MRVVVAIKLNAFYKKVFFIKIYNILRFVTKVKNVNFKGIVASINTTTWISNRSSKNTNKW